MASLAPTELDFFEDVPEDLRSWIKAELEPGERVLWAARALPPRGVYVSGHWIAIGWIVGLATTCAACLFLALGPPRLILKDIGAVLAVIGTIAGLIAVLVTIGTVSAWVSGVFDRRRARPAWYALTDRRAITWAPNPWNDALAIASIARGSIDRISRNEYPDGTGDVVFDSGRSGPTGEGGFRNVAEVRRVEALARSILLDPEAGKRRRPDDTEITMLDDGVA